MSPCRFDRVRVPVGLTLLELVVVLGILAVLSTIAVRSLEPIADQARYEQSQLLLNRLRQAITGSQEVTSPALATPISGYAPDTGAYPPDLASLLIRPPGVIERSLQAFDSDRDLIDDIQLTSGWNGPYLTLGAGADLILDGWGAEPTLILNSGNLEILSMGSDGDSLPPEEGYRKDLKLTIQSKDYQGSAVFKLYAIDANIGSRVDPNPTGTQQLGILFYGVNAAGGDIGAIEEQLIVISNSGGFEYRRDNTLVGVTAARAILWDDADSDEVLDSDESIVAKSIVHYPVILPGVDTRVEMELR